MLAYDLTFEHPVTLRRYTVRATERASLGMTSDLAKAFLFLAGISTLYALELTTVDNFSDTALAPILQLLDHT